MLRIAKAVGTLGIVGCYGMFSPSAMADDSYWYGGLNVGQSRAKIDDPRIRSGLLEDGFTTTSITDDNRDTGYKLYGGYQLNRYLGVEGGYFNLGEFGYRATTIPAGVLNGTARFQGINLDAVGTVPINEQFSVFGRVGVNYSQARDSFSGSGAITVANPNISRRDTNYKFGVGLQYALTRALAVRLEAERYRVNDAVGHNGDIDLISVGLVYRFGHDSPVTARVEAPQPMPPAPPAAVVVAPPPPPPPAPRRVTFSADSLFDFDRDIVKPAGKKALDEFVANLQGTQFDVIVVSGYTDRLGPQAYNQRLSERRAEAVKNYLIQSAGIQSARISAKGLDGSNPVTAPGECKGTHATPQLIACLQPDRRVVIEVSGSR